MACSADQNNLAPEENESPSVPGFGSPTAPVQSELPSFDPPSELLEDIAGLAQQISAQFPSGTFKTNPDFSMKNVLDFVSNILTQISPLLSTYNFFISLLKLPSCLIEVLCAIPNPFAMAQKLKKLFTECVPPYLNLFPVAALVVMIISLLLLVLAIVEYIIQLFTDLVTQILNNLLILADGITLNDAQSALAAANKIASLLCFVQNVLAIFIALAAIMDVIKSLAKTAGFLLCADGGDEGCCTEDICPDFIKNTPNGITVDVGTLKYTSQVGVDIETVLGIPADQASIFNIPPIREERWQLYDTDPSPQYPIGLIITSINDNIFWPDPLEFDGYISLKKAPYIVDVTLTTNPNTFGITDILGEREFVIKDCVVVRKPYYGVYQYNNEISDTPRTGTLNIEGGLVYESDGVTPYMIGSSQATLNNFIHLPDSVTDQIPGSDDSITISNVSFTWKPNGAALAGYQLTTIGCMPEVNVEKAAQNAIISANGIDPIIDRLPAVPDGVAVPTTGDFLPNINGTQQCILNALTELRKEVSAAKVAEFQASFETCLSDLKNQTTATLCAALLAAVSQFDSEIAVDTNLQFTTRNIQAIVTLKSGALKSADTAVNIAVGIPEECGNAMAELLEGEVTVGTISKFRFNQTDSNFIADISSDIAGEGILTVNYNNKTLSTITPGTVGGNSTSIDEIQVNYQFIDGTIAPPVRRNVGDIV